VLRIVPVGRAEWSWPSAGSCCAKGFPRLFLFREVLEGGSASVDGTYLMTASAETSLALALPGEDYTAFTGALVDKLVTACRTGA
jgi:hypothetical protein